MAESMRGLHRTCRCAELTEEYVGKTVTVMGWVAKQRNKGGIVFVDLRDRSGLIQLIYEEADCGEENFHKAEKMRAEFVVAATGTVTMRSGAVNPNLPTGTIEVRVTDTRILSESETPPFHIVENSNTKEELRLQYRSLDLRRPDMQRKLMLRSRIVQDMRTFMDGEGFLEIETPILCKSTPEGARDYLVPSRVKPGTFYALPQSPQIFKQLLMCSGYDRYFQIARCFRDEDLRADRQPEFTQADMELSFVDVDDVIDVENHLHHAYLIFVDIFVELFLHLRFAHVVASESQLDSRQWTSERGVSSLDRLSGQTGGFAFCSTHDNDNVLGAELLCEFLNPPLVLQVHGASCRSDEALSRGEHDFAASGLDASRNCLAGYAIAVANYDNFLAG